MSNLNNSTIAIIIERKKTKSRTFMTCSHRKCKLENRDSLTTALIYLVIK